MHKVSSNLKDKNFQVGEKEKEPLFLNAIVLQTNPAVFYAIKKSGVLLTPFSSFFVLFKSR